MLQGNMNHLQSNNLKIFVETGFLSERFIFIKKIFMVLEVLKDINITKLYIGLGQPVCASLPGFHSISECDCKPSFFQKGKIRPSQIPIKKSKLSNGIN